MILYWGIRQQGRILALLYESLTGEVMVWPGFASTSVDRSLVMSKFTDGGESLLVEISFHPGNAVATNRDHPE
jgi:hypothetical protein